MYLGMHSPVDVFAGLYLGLHLFSVWAAIDVYVDWWMMHGHWGACAAVAAATSVAAHVPPLLQPRPRRWAW